jgi:hypothetical protein
MGILNNFFKSSSHPLPELVTCLISKDVSNGEWQASGIEVKLPSSLNEHNLDKLVGMVDQCIKQMCEEKGSAPRAELQLAIYPWKMGKEVKHIFLIAKTSAGFTAKDRQSDDLEVTGNTYEDIVSQIKLKIDDTDTAMLQLIQPIENL